MTQQCSWIPDQSISHNKLILQLLKQICTLLPHEKYSFLSVRILSKTLSKLRIILDKPIRKYRYIEIYIYCKQEHYILNSVQGYPQRMRLSRRLFATLILKFLYKSFILSLSNYVDIRGGGGGAFTLYDTKFWTGCVWS